MAVTLDMGAVSAWSSEEKFPNLKLRKYGSPIKSLPWRATKVQGEVGVEVNYGDQEISLCTVCTSGGC